MGTVIEVVEHTTGKVIHTVNCHDRSVRETERVEDGMNINLDHARFYTRVKKGCHEATIRNR